MLQPSPVIPRSVLLVSPLLLFLLMGGSRALYRTVKEFYRYGGLVAQGKPVIVLGAGHAGASLARELSRSQEWRLVGLLDDDPAKQGREIYGFKVHGAISDLQRWADDSKPNTRSSRFRLHLLKRSGAWRRCVCEQVCGQWYCPR